MRPRPYQHRSFGESDGSSKMTNPRRNVGREILTGIRQLKRGRVGRVVTLPPIAEIRAKVGLSQSEFARLLSLGADASGMGAGAKDTVGPGAYAAIDRESKSHDPS